MTFVSESIEVAVPAERVFALLSDAEAMPKFLSIVKHVEPRGEVSRWSVEAVGQKREVDVRVAESVEPERIRWESVNTSKSFKVEALTEALGEASTRVTLNLDFDAGGVAERMGLAKGAAQIALRREMTSAKRYIESAAG